MRTNNNYYTFPLLSLAFICCHTLWAQEKGEEDDLGTQQVTVTKSYTPSLSDAFKLSTDEVSTAALLPAAKELQFKAQEIEVVSTFIPNKATPLKLQRTVKQPSTNSQVSLGFGNLGQLLFDAAARARLDSQQALGLDVFVEREGNLPDGVLPSSRSQTNLAATHNFNTSQFAAFHQMAYKAAGSHYYGLYPDDTTINDPLRNELLDFQQQFYSVTAKSHWQWYDKWLERIHADLRYTGDLFGTTEQAAQVKANFRINLFNAYLDIRPQFDYLQTEFQQSYYTRDQQKFNQTKAGVLVQLADVRNKFKYKIGARAQYLMGDRNDNTPLLFIYPDVFLAYSDTNKKMQPYLMVGGNLRLNSYHSAFQQNPFVAPTLELIPTDEKYKGELGFTTLFKSGIEFKLAGQYSQSDNFTLFQRYAFDPTVTENGYRLANAFGWIYDTVTQYGARVGLRYKTKNQSEIQLNLQQNTYTLENQSQAWNLPDLEADFVANIRLTSKVHWYFNAQFLGNRPAAYRPVLLQQNPELNQPVLENLTPVSMVKTEFSYRLYQQWYLFMRYRSVFGAQAFRWAYTPLNQNLFLIGGRYKLNLNL